MREKNSDGISVNGLGTGYVSLIMIFVMICLTALAAMSFSAAGMSDSLSDKHSGNMAAYYAAESEANRTLMQVDDAALKAAESGLFMNFEALAAEIENITVKGQMSGDYTVSWSRDITDKLALMCEITVFAAPKNGVRYEITRWQTAPAGAAASADAPLNVWDGTF